MRAAFLQDVETLVVRDVPDPLPASGSIMVRVRVCSICGTDLRVYHHGHPRVTFPQVIGHEISGEIAAVNRPSSSFRIGDRVAVTPRVSCGVCFYCRKGQQIHCLNGRTFGFQLQGGFAEYMLIPDFAVDFDVINRVADGVGFEEASMAEPLACCIRAQRAAVVSPGDTVAVVGGGPVGVMHCRLARANGAHRVILIERDAHRIGLVDLGVVDEFIVSAEDDVVPRVAALTEGQGADVVIVACSSVQAQEQAIALVGRGGRIDFFGGLSPDHDPIRIDGNLLHYKEISLRGTHSCLPADTYEALELLAARRIDISDLTTHRFPLESIAEAFEFADSREGMHVAVWMPG